MNKTLRIFLSSSGLSTLYLSIYARQSAKGGETDLFFIDALSLKPSQRDLMLQAVAHHSYEQIYDLSRPMGETVTMVPSRRKQLTRQLKTKVGFKQVYNFLYKYKLMQEDRMHMRTLHDRAGKYLQQEYERVELHLQPMLHLNRAFQKLFPKAQVRYFEHGLGDYLDFDVKMKQGDLFHCVFASSLKHYYNQTGRKSDHIFPVVSTKGFLDPALDLDSLFPQLQEIDVPRDQHIALIAVQALEQFQVEPKYWDHFLDLCVERIDDPEDLLFLVKPHPRQDPDIVARICQYLEGKGLSVLVWDKPELRSLSMEILFSILTDQVKYVFSPFSSTVFYLSELYPSSSIQYYYSLQSVLPFTTNTPELYVKRWKSLHPYLQEVFGKRAVEM